MEIDKPALWQALTAAGTITGIPAFIFLVLWLLPPSWAVVALFIGAFIAITVWVYDDMSNSKDTDDE